MFKFVIIRSLLVRRIWRQKKTPKNWYMWFTNYCKDNKLFLKRNDSVAVNLFISKMITHLRKDQTNKSMRLISCLMELRHSTRIEILFLVFVILIQNMGLKLNSISLQHHMGRTFVMLQIQWNTWLLETVYPEAEHPIKCKRAFYLDK